MTGTRGQLRIRRRADLWTKRPTTRSIAIAVLVPLALLLAALLAGRRAWRRSQRERALDPS